MAITAPISKVQGMFITSAIQRIRKMDSQKQSTGDKSVAIQAHGDVYYGVTPTEARQIALDVYNANYLRLSKEAGELSCRRAEELIDDFLAKLQKEAPTAINEVRNPDMQFALYSAQSAYARTGEKDLEKLLVQLCVDRSQVENRNLKQIALNEAIDVAAKLLPEQLDILSIIFNSRYSARTNILNNDLMGSFLDAYIKPFFDNVNGKDSLFQHLEYTGCGIIQITEISLEACFKNNYKGIFSKGFNEVDFSTLTPNGKAFIMQCINDQSKYQVIPIFKKDTLSQIVRDGLITEDDVKRLDELSSSNICEEPEIKEILIRIRPYMNDVLNTWHRTLLKNMTLTSVGIAIAHANSSRKTGDKSDLSIWL